MIDRENLLEQVSKKLKQIKNGSALDIRSYKRNRSIVIYREDKYNYSLYEDGFEVREHKDLPYDKVIKLFKQIEKREFPRSNKVRLYMLEDKADFGIHRMSYGEIKKRKKEISKTFNVLISLPIHKRNYLEFLISKSLGDNEIDYINNNLMEIRIDVSEEQFSNIIEIPNLIAIKV